jgi:hypothetical protein
MRPSVAALLVALVLSSSSALAERTQIWMASGLAGGTYQAVYARNLVKMLRDYDTLHRPSTGSGQNLDLLADGKADIAFSQADVYASRLGSDPARYGSLLVIGKLADECVYIAHRRAGPVTDLAGLGSPVGARPARFAAGAEGGGMSGTWSHLTTLDPSLAAAQVVYEGDTLALNQLAVGAFDAVGWVTDPNNFDHKMLRAVMKNDALHIMSLSAPSLLSALPDGTRVYDARNVKLTASWRAPKIQTICTSALMLTRKDAEPELIDKLADVLSLSLTRLTGRR